MLRSNTWWPTKEIISSAIQGKNQDNVNSHSGGNSQIFDDIRDRQSRVISVSFSYLSSGSDIHSDSELAATAILSPATSEDYHATTSEYAPTVLTFNDLVVTVKNKDKKVLIDHVSGSIGLRMFKFILMHFVLMLRCSRYLRGKMHIIITVEAPKLLGGTIGGSGEVNTKLLRCLI